MFANVNAQVVPIISITNNNSSGLPIDTGQFKTVTGIVTVANEFGGPAYIQDSQAGIADCYRKTFSVQWTY